MSGLNRDYFPGRRGLLVLVALAASISLLLGGWNSNALSQSSSTGNQFYVAPNGSASGDGSIDNPWDLKTAFDHPSAVKPGDTIWLRGGTYTGIFNSRLTGTVASPITVRSYSGEWARVDAAGDTTNDVINVSGRATRYIDFEILRSGFNRYINRSGCGIERFGIDVNAGDNKFINLVIHDTSLGIGAFRDAPNTEVYGNILYYNGWVENIGVNQGRGCDHGFYGQNSEGIKTIKDNITFQNFSIGITPHGTNIVELNNFEIEGNVMFNNGVIRTLVPGRPMEGRNFWWSNCCPTANVAQNLRFVRNYMYYPSTIREAGSFFLLSATNNAVVTDNYMIGGDVYITGGPHTNLNFRDNKVLADSLVGFNPAVFLNNTYFAGTPNLTDVIVRQNQYDAKRAHVIIYNWQRRNDVDVDISSLGWSIGDTYELRNVQDYFNDITKGTYTGGGKITVQMTSRSVATPVGWPTPASSLPEFGVFVLVRNPFTAPIQPVSFVGGISKESVGGPQAVVVGYGRVQPDPGSISAAGLAIFAYRNAEQYLVSEASVPAVAPIQSGRIYAEVNSSLSTGIAIANANSQPAVISFYFTDANGQTFGQSSTTVAANQQVAMFLNEAPFNGGSSVQGSFTFTSSVPVGVIALRGLLNQRNDFLMTTLPVLDLSAAVRSTTSILPHFADGCGGDGCWTTQILVVNPTDSQLSGRLEFWGTGSPTASAQPAAVTIGGQTNTTFAYSIPPRSSQRFQTAGLAPQLQSGSVRIIPAPTNNTPFGQAVFTFRNSGGLTVSEASVPAQPLSTAFRMYTESTGLFGQIGSVESGVAIANPSSVGAVVGFELLTLAGASTGMTGTMTVPGNGQLAAFLSQIPGLAPPSGFSGVLRVSTTAPSGLSVTGLRSRYNERGEFLITTTPPSDEAVLPLTSELLFPHLANGGGYTTQIILYSPLFQPVSGLIRFFTQLGQPLNLPLK